MRDFVPSEKAHRDRVLELITATYRAHGFDEIETPVMEDSDRLNAGLGGDNEKLAFGVLKRGLTKDDFAKADQALDLVDLGLRFDLTVPLARFYATHRAELPTVFRAIQAAPVWRAERPQKGRYRQFVQCDIDVIGEPGILAEVELITATIATLEALGLEGVQVRINDRRLLTGMLDTFGFPSGEHASVLITIDKLDKVGQAGVISELRDRAFPAAPVDALEAFFRRPMTMEFLSFSEKAIRKFLPAMESPAIAELAAIGAALGEASRYLHFDPFLVRGMGYYTGTIFEVAHPSVEYSLGGGGRYDGMIGRFLGTDVPAVGFSLGFERIVDLVKLDAGSRPDARVLIYEPDLDPAVLLAAKLSLMGGEASAGDDSGAAASPGSRVRLERKPKNLKPLFEQLASEGFTRYAFVTADGVGDFSALTRE